MQLYKSVSLDDCLLLNQTNLQNHMQMAKQGDTNSRKCILSHYVLSVMKRPKYPTHSLLPRSILKNSVFTGCRQKQFVYERAYILMILSIFWQTFSPQKWEFRKFELCGQVEERRVSLTLKTKTIFATYFLQGNDRNNFTYSWTNDTKNQMRISNHNL